METNLFDVAAILVLLAAGFGLFNHHVLRLPFTIGLTVSGLVASGGVLLLDALMPHLGLGSEVRAAVEGIDFYEFLMHGALSILLFGGALHVNLDDLLERKGTVLTLAFVGVLISTCIVGFGSWCIFAWVGLDVPLKNCLVFGALISPTDPVAVLGIMTSVGAPKGLETKVAGESLFNDGIGVVVFSVLLLAATSGGEHGGGMDALAVAELFAREVAGGVLLGLVCGYATYRAMKTLDEPNLEILLSVALVLGMSLVAFKVHTSAPLACVVAGLFIGNHGRHFAMKQPSREALDLIWSFIDQTFNAVLFLLVGLEVVRVQFEAAMLIGALLLVPWTLLARWISVLVPISILKLGRDFSPGVVKVLTWGGLKGGISVALAIYLFRKDFHFQGREAILAATYAVVIFSIIVQGMTIGPLIRKVVPSERVREFQEEADGVA